MSWFFSEDNQVCNMFIHEPERCGFENGLIFRLLDYASSNHRHDAATQHPLGPLNDGCQLMPLSPSQLVLP